MVQMKRPLDFEAVTDHAEYMGTVRLANDPKSDLSKLPIAEKLTVRSKEDMEKVYLFLATSLITEPIKELTRPRSGRLGVEAESRKSPTSTTSRASSRPSPPTNGARRRTIATCTATSSSRTPRRYRCVPFSAIDSSHPEDLWNWMDGQRKAGNEVLAISHNANLSDGVMFPLEVDSKGRPIDAAWAQIASEQRAAVRDPAAQGRIRDAPGAVAQRRVRAARDFGISPRRRRSRAEAARQLHPRGLRERPGDAGDARLQPVQVRRGRRQRHAQHGGRRTPNRTISAATACSTPRRRRA